MRELCLLPFLLAACGGSGNDATCAATSMDAVQTNVFDGCSLGGNGGCHTAAPFGANLDLTSGMAYAYLVHAPSNSSPGKFRVEPNDLDNSFLWRKLTNKIADDGSEGVPMPRYQTVSGEMWRQLPQSQLDAVRCWINNGANP